jgi:hypothetical protein
LMVAKAPMLRPDAKATRFGFKVMQGFRSPGAAGDLLESPTPT